MSASMEYIEDEGGCEGSGFYICYCGGDNCICDWNGEIPCEGCDDCEGGDDGYYED